MFCSRASIFAFSASRRSWNARIVSAGDVLFDRRIAAEVEIPAAGLNLSACVDIRFVCAGDVRIGEHLAMRPPCVARREVRALHRFRLAEMLVAVRHVETVEPRLPRRPCLVEEQEVRRDARVRREDARGQADDRVQVALREELFLDVDLRIVVAEKKPVRQHNSGAPALSQAVEDEHEEEIGFWKFLQYEFAIQWKKLKAYANAKGIQILGDIPIYVSADSVDAWVGGPLFELAADGSFARVAGCPPDYFSADGQLWGNPLYNWPYHRETGYAWWIERIRHALGIYDLLRIDHFRGFDTYWAIPAGSTTAKDGKWEIGPRMELFHALENALGKLPIIAEDLGDIVDSVRELLAESGFPGMKVLQFAFGGGDNEYLPHNHVRNSVVYPGTHDNTTLTAWWEIGAAEKEKAMACAYLHLTPCHPTAKEVAAVKTDAARVALLRAALGSASERAIIPMADWLGLGEEGHVNTPGRLGGNWTWRAAAGFGTKKLAKEILGECEAVCRA